MAARDPGLPLSSPEWGGSEPEGETATEGNEAEGAGAWLQLEPTEIRRRLDGTIRELGNRRKILIRNLPHDCSIQDIHDLLKNYEIKYCYVDKNKKTAFITLTNGDQAQDAISTFHKQIFRDKEMWVQLQPTDALLCVTNLPPALTLQEFEDLARTYGSTERCLLVYSELSGHFKGYGFVEYMKKDSASKARLELLGKQLEDCTLFAQWVDVNQLTADFIHSKCLLVDKLPKDYSNTEELTEIFSSIYRPTFCQLAEEEDGGYSGGFAVVEYETAMEAEEVRDSLDGMTVSGSRIQISFCAPGSPGRSVLAALVAAQGMLQNNRKGLLPEPNTAQIIQSLNNPAMLQMLLHPRGRSGKHGSSGQPHFMNPTVSQALLQLNKLQQKPTLPGNVLMQNYSNLQVAHQQLLQLKSSQSNNSKPGLLGEAPVSMLQASMGGTVQTGSVEAAQREMPKNLLPYYHNLPRLPQDKQSAPAPSEGSILTGQNPLRGPAGTPDSLHGNKTTNQTSLLGEPPRDFRLSTNPYLNLASVLPGVSLRALQSHNMDGLISQDAGAQPALDGYFTYSQQYGDYSQEALQQWYDQYSNYSGAQNEAPGDSSQSSSALGYGEYNAYVQAPPTYYGNAQQALYQPGVTASAEKVMGSEKRAYLLASPDVGGYSEHYGPASGDSDAYFKRKKVY